ncbi:MAG TPA: tRNA (adenosine(37)-N6)-dimethylallyltransferase MiaA [Sedimentibacter sp.]|jgi:tRNA dimethylallyltransferase|nr:tRNA (adenosine(37)-N6)-dimethylallyltransferase MiaA [Sedimentibacter sp.]HOG62663.1 tRNA (adenosine(37)-N6)-dimethylallyltransferase MiaA [Sedimentibacter sp.]HOT21351.1 tRNA (adenosine(37)-N6)-dimethylallyltransferase MiaA [Sedimentibacter sp.]HQK53238.1 tRNA (adenosine(37)-N6)-dimethylallyltransferase MiaA [Sedimentibacter sp.]
MNKIIVIVGPTAVGKTYISVELAKKLNTEIISADSMQIYKGMNIGTAKITEEEKQGIIHHMIDIINPDEEYSVSEFKYDAEKIIDRLLSENRIPIIVGGSGLYVNSLIYDLDFGNTKSNKKLREYYTYYYKEHGEDALYDKLLKIDPVAAEKIHKNNIKRIIRALEVYDITGVKFSELNTDIRKKSNKYDCILIGLSMERKVLYERINQRVDEMLSKGLVDEVSSLIKKGYGKNLVSMRGIGYKEIIEYLEGNTDYEEAVNTLKQNTRRFAKRQYTWFLKDENVKWFSMDNPSEIDKTLDSIVEYISTRIDSISNQ